MVAFQDMVKNIKIIYWRYCVYFLKIRELFTLACLVINFENITSTYNEKIIFYFYILLCWYNQLISLKMSFYHIFYHQEKIFSFRAWSLHDWNTCWSLNSLFYCVDYAPTCTLHYHWLRKKGFWRHKVFIIWKN